jgi:hypothetical protein
MRLFKGKINFGSMIKPHAGFPWWRPGFEPRSGHVGFVVDKTPLEQVFSKYFDFPCQFSFN